MNHGQNAPIDSFISANDLTSQQLSLYMTIPFTVFDTGVVFWLLISWDSVKPLYSIHTSMLTNFCRSIDFNGTSVFPSYRSMIFIVPNLPTIFELA